MPVYEYLCRHCNRIYSFLFATMTDEGRPTCPRCGAVDLEREVSLFAFVRGGTDPFAASPKPDEDADEDEVDDAPAPVRDPGLYRQDWDGRYARLRDRPADE